MTENIAGIDFSGLNKFRETVTVNLPNDKTIELPLITMRDAEIATSYLREYEVLFTKYNIIASKSMQKADAVKDAGDDREGEEGLTDREAEILMKTADSIIDFHKELRGVHGCLYKLCDEILDFISKYYEDKSVIEFLRTCGTAYIVKVLELMLFGKEAVTSKTEEQTEENPTETTTQKN